MLQVNVLQRKSFFFPSFEIYGCVAGFYDYGPNGCKVKQNITQFWRQHFVLHENMLEVGPVHGVPGPCSGPASTRLQTHSQATLDW